MEPMLLKRCTHSRPCAWREVGNKDVWSSCLEHAEHAVCAGRGARRRARATRGPRRQRALPARGQDARGVTWGRGERASERAAATAPSLTQPRAAAPPRLGAPRIKAPRLAAPGTALPAPRETKPRTPRPARTPRTRSGLHAERLHLLRLAGECSPVRCRTLGTARLCACALDSTLGVKLIRALRRRDAVTSQMLLPKQRLSLRG
ncbi:unnamed protein product [Lampetra planeri]